MKKGLRTIAGSAIVGACLWCPGAGARDPVAVTISVPGEESRTFSFSSVDSGFDTLLGGSLRVFFPSYTGTNADTQAFIDVRGLPFNFAFPDESTRLVFEVRSLNFVQEFAGNTRDDSMIQFREFFRREGAGIVSVVLREFARISPIDPIAGNPNSMMSLRAASDFERAFRNKTSQVWSCSSSAFLDLGDEPPLRVVASEAVPGLFEDWEQRMAGRRATINSQAGAEVRTTDAAGFRSQSLQIPLGYSRQIGSDQRRRFAIDFTPAMTDTESARTYYASLGGRYTEPLTEDWSLTPGLGLAYTGSRDLGSFGALWSASIASSYNLRVSNFGIGIGNMIGYYQTLPVDASGYESDPDIASTFVTNGVLVSGPGSLISQNLVLEYFLTDTRLLGDEVYSQYYDEIGISLGRFQTDAFGAVDSMLRGSLSYLRGDGDIDAIRLSLSYRF